MAAKRRSPKSAVQRQKASETASKLENTAPNREEKDKIIAEYLPPLSLTLIVLVCSGTLFLFCLRDFMVTGKNVAGPIDEAYLTFTKSTQWFDGSKGWKSTQGGFSAIKDVTTDDNNMGGFFIRKLAGAAGTAVHLHKLLPFMMHETNAKFSFGHFKPLLLASILGNIAIAIFFASYYEDLQDAGAFDLPLRLMGLLAFETVAMLYCIVTTPSKRGPATKMVDEKTPSSFVSNIVSRTILLVSTAVGIVSARNLFFPGTIIDLIPRDDIYLEWTNAFFHSPPIDSPEAIEQGIMVPMFIGDKFMSQLGALYMLILCMYKFVSAVYVRLGSDGSGTYKARMIWKGAFLGDAFIVFVIRMFVNAAMSASFDFRWHLVLFSYEAFVLGLYGFF